MPRKAEVVNSLTRGRVRTSWNKFNLFNLYKKRSITFPNKSLYQQKWASKTETRGYHGEHLTESRWQTMFSPKLEGVAQLDASMKGENNKDTPMALQTFAILEKRLDFALFRAMFASSVRQARQFILYGEVYVNGIRIRHPGYTLKPGDVFSVDPEKVLMALSKPKPSVAKAVKIDNYQSLRWNQYVKAVKDDPQGTWNRKNARVFRSVEGESEAVRKQKVTNHNSNVLKQMLAKQKTVSRGSILKDILKTANNQETVKADIFTTQFGGELSGKCIQVYEYLAKHPLAVVKDISDSDLETKINEFIASKEAAKETMVKKVKQLLSEINTQYLEFIRKTYESKMVSENTKTLPYDPSFADSLTYFPKLDKEAILEDESKAKVRFPWQSHLYGRKDPSKPYFTPFTPRGFLAPFAILPSHIEISFETCHAVYLRDPIARPGQSEVISPFPVPIHERAYMYYVKNGK